MLGHAGVMNDELDTLVNVVRVFLDAWLRHLKSWNLLYGSWNDVLLLLLMYD